LRISSIPKGCIGFIVARGKDAVMELVVADVFNLTVVEVEIGERSDLLALFPTAYIPNR
jgi:hypothetical protein